MTRTVPAVVAGLGAGIAYAAVQEIDLRLTGRNVDDLAMLGRPFVHEPRQIRLLGLGIHLLNSVVLALVYAKVCHFLPVPPAVRGAAFALIENTVLYPMTRLVEDHHPGIREGSVARYWTWPAFIQSIPRHLAYGIVLGVLFERLAGDQQIGRPMERPDGINGGNRQFNGRSRR